MGANCNEQWYSTNEKRIYNGTMRANCNEKMKDNRNGTMVFNCNGTMRANITDIDIYL